MLWSLPPPPLPLAQVPAVSRERDGLIIHAERVVHRIPEGETLWIGNVRVSYGETTVEADRLLVHDAADDQFAEAFGHVRLSDPEGDIHASDLQFSWAKQTGVAHNVVVRVGSLQVTADSIHIQPGLWTLFNVAGTPCPGRMPFYFIRTRELTIRPGVGGSAKRPEISILGHKIATLPDHEFRFGGESGSFNLPYPSYRSDRGFGLTWQAGIPLSPATKAFTRYAAFQHSLPYYSLNLMHSFTAAAPAEVVRSELGERFSFGYFDNVTVADPGAESDYLRVRRAEVGLATLWGADGRDTTDAANKVNKPIEVLGQAAGELGGFGWLGLVRAQSIRIGNGPAHRRGVFEGDLSGPRLSISRSLSVVSRADIAQFFDGGGYGWIRGSAGLVYEPNATFRLGASYASGRDYGAPLFAFDELERSQELSLRGDLILPNTRLRVLLKFSPDRRILLDDEIYLSQVVGCVEPFIVYRKHPHKFFVGIRLPIFDELQRVSERVRKRVQVISTIGDPAP